MVNCYAESSSANDRKRILMKVRTGIGWLLFLILALAVQAGAEVKPGDAIGAESASKVKDLVSPGAYYALQHGMRMNVVATDRIDWPPPYKDATEKYSGQVRLTPDH